MLKCVTLQNFKGFGRVQRVPLSPLTVLVGPNNAGKSNFMQASRFVKNALLTTADDAAVAEDGAGSLFHRPTAPDQDLVIGWETEDGEYEGRVRTLPGSGLASAGERLTEAPGFDVPFPSPSSPVAALSSLISRHRGSAGSKVALAMVNSSLVRLSLDALRREAQVVESPRMGADGTGIAAVLGSWQGVGVDLLAPLDAFFKTCTNDIESIRAKPGRMPGHQALVFRHRSGELVSALEASDGLVMFAGLAMTLISAGPRSTLFIEEPETCIHPRRLRHLVDLMRTAVSQQGCQIVLATHSTVLLNAVREEPEAILLVRRGPAGTEIVPCLSVPGVVDALQDSSPGEMLETAFFEGLWSSVGS